jgi:deuterolysin
MGINFNYDTANAADDVFMVLAPGASTDTVVDVAALYAIEGGVYTVSATDVIEYAAMNSTVIEGVIPYESNELEIEITADEIAKHDYAVVPLEKRTVVSQCSGSQSTALRAAIDYTVGLAGNAATAAQSGSSSKFQEYFRTTASGTRSNVASRFRAVAQEASSQTSGNTRYFCGDALGACRQGVIAYTQPASNIIANCDIFYQLPAVSRGCGDQSQASTVLHEFTHAPGIFPPSTQDFAYGYSASTRLSASQAVNNADNYALYADAIDNNC